MFAMNPDDYDFLNQIIQDEDVRENIWKKIKELTAIAPLKPSTDNTTFDIQKMKQIEKELKQQYDYKPTYEFNVWDDEDEQDMRAERFKDIYEKHMRKMEEDREKKARVAMSLTTGFSPEEVEQIMDLKASITPHRNSIKGWNDNYVIAGGIFVSYFHSQPYKDIDVFLLNAGELVHEQVLPDYKPERYKASGANTYLRNSNVVACYDDTYTKFQYIFTKYKTRRELLEDFDYLHCCASYQAGKLHINRAIFNAIRDKKLVINNEAAVKTYRMEKFLAAGFTK